MRLSKLRKQIVMCLDAISFLIIGIGLLFVNFITAKEITNMSVSSALFNLMALTICIVFFQMIFHTHESLWRYAESDEYLRLLASSVCGGTLYGLLVQIVFKQQVSIILIIAVISCGLIGMICTRFVYRTYRRRRMLETLQDRKRVAIIGAGQAGVALASEMRVAQKSPYLPICFIDDDKQKIGMRALGLPVRGPINELPKIILQDNIKELFFAIPACATQRRKEILDICAKTTCRIRILPDRMTLAEERNATLLSQVANIKVEDLLGREPIHLNLNHVSPFVQGKRILVTGAGGSIGSELCRQIAALNPKTLVILDIYENNIYDTEQFLRAQYGNKIDLHVIIASIRDRSKLDQVFSTFKPQIVFHAAAHKHVPLMEENPEEAIKNNIFGTWHLLLAANSHKVEKFVQISTDKAVNPTNVMGATKRFCEMMLQSIGSISQTDFVAVRFGNVLGSNGSVIPLFKSQIERGGPVTITDKRIIRYFMTIPEAVSLVLEAGAMAKQSEIYILDMGQPVKIIDLAENLIRMAGFVPYTEMPIVEIGLRPGEKLFEELLTGDASLSKTAHDKIFVEKPNAIPKAEIESGLQKLQRAIDSRDKSVIVRTLHQVVLTYHTPEEVNDQGILQA